MTGVRLLVEGRVQGVGFRRFVQRVAEELGAVGRVRNLPDGRVEIEAFGTAEVLDALRAEVARGSRTAIVTKVEKTQILDEADRPRHM